MEPLEFQKVFMLRVNKLADYAAWVMVHMANEPNQLYNARAINEKTHIQLPTVSKILKKLTNAGLLSSKRGSQGGYALAQAAEHISLAAIIRAIEEDISLTECIVEGENNCALESFCTMKDNWLSINGIIQSVLEDISLADMLHNDKRLSQKIKGMPHDRPN